MLLPTGDYKHDGPSVRHEIQWGSHESSHQEGTGYVADQDGSARCGPRGGTTTSRERIINIFISGFLYVFTFIYKDGSTSICSILADCSAWSRKCSLR